MKSKGFYPVLLFVVIGCTYGHKNDQNAIEQNSAVSDEKDKPLAASETKTIKIACDSFDLFNYPAKSAYQKFRNETVQNQEGFGVYFDKAIVNLSKETTQGNHEILRIHYELQPLFAWGNWMSVRKEFTEIINAGSCQGIMLKLKVEKPSNAKLRLTFCDIEKDEDLLQHGSDEMWWFDFEEGILNSKGDWLTLYAPFNKFINSYGEGTRHNDAKMDISKFVAYEINVISEKGKTAKGYALIDSIGTF